MSYAFRYVDLPKYDLATAKVGDEVIVARNNRWDKYWYVFCCKVKSVSSKRGEVTFSNGDRYKKNGTIIGSASYSRTYTVFLQNVDKTRERVKEHYNMQKCLCEAKSILDVINSGNYDALSDLTPKKLVEFRDILKEFFPDFS